MALNKEFLANKFDNMPEEKTLFGDEKWMVMKMKKACIMILGNAVLDMMIKFGNE